MGLAMASDGWWSDFRHGVHGVGEGFSWMCGLYGSSLGVLLLC